MGQTRRQSESKWKSVTVDKDVLRTLAKMAELHRLTPPAWIAAIVDWTNARTADEQARMIRGEPIEQSKTG